MLTNDIKTYIEKSVLCWLATVDKDGQPNVSPKEIFAYSGDTTLLIAHIASPGTLANLKENPKVCVSFVDVFIQKGYKIKGTAKILKKKDPSFLEKSQLLKERFTDRFPISAVVEISVTGVEPIQAPSYVFFPDTTTENDQIESALKTYGVSQMVKED
ncbi:pyridoxamine 5'-phosphate oxidase family protein [Olivibacter sp. SDN3]|uniref:pyridoxamine 5'-phosphate oxidase family protein n=1 Tax=Olivibacter sp. SDN3 TaxID=2764720 RepID=UPI001651A3F4|nr:pyridoxamine 5'-phosphate oxidase family protein [Olivibacter sp. SDN3]QNL48105.1 pyridoxamine 5'-phosphate oxidase family protein [Olivibacter sp. SDN3]